jgi:hypothetical protein
MDAPKFKDYILPLVFLKRLSDVFAELISLTFCNMLQHPFTVSHLPLVVLSPKWEALIP